MKKIKEILEFKLISISDFVLTPVEILQIIGIAVGGWILIRVLKAFLTRTRKKRGWIDEGQEYTIVQLIKYFVYTLVIVFCIQSLGVDITVLLAGSAALFVGIGLGLQSTFNDVVSGIILLFERTITVGDVVEIDGLIGVVDKINIRTSLITTRGSITIIVPNSKLVTDKVVNWSHGNPITRFEIKVGVAYGSNTRLVEKVLIESAVQHSDVIDDPETRVRFIGFGESSLDFELLIWSDKVWEIEFIKSDIRFTIDQAFRDNGITIPFPQRDLYIKSGGLDSKKEGN